MMGKRAAYSYRPVIAVKLTLPASLCYPPIIQKQSTERAGESPAPTKSMWAKGRPARFALVFALCFLSGIGLLLTPTVQKWDLSFSRSLVSVAHTIIGTCGGKSLLQGAVLRDPGSGFAVEMRDGCNAVNVTILLWSAVLAFPAGWRLKLAGIV